MQIRRQTQSEATTKPNRSLFWRGSQTPPAKISVVVVASDCVCLRDYLRFIFLFCILFFYFVLNNLKFIFLILFGTQVRVSQFRFGHKLVQPKILKN